MSVGSFASSYWGSPRSTQDGNLVVAISIEQLERLLPALQDAFYIPEGAARHAVTAGGMFNLIELESAAKVDLIVLDEHERARRAFARRQQGELLERPARYASPEDTIVAKLDRVVMPAGWPGAKSEHMGDIRVMSNAARRPAVPADSYRINRAVH